MNRNTIILICLVGPTVLLGALAFFEQPSDWWLTADQQADRLMMKEQYAAAAERYENPLRQGVALYRDGQFEQAALAFSRVDSPESAFNRGDALLMMGLYDSAIGSYDRALQLQPGWVEAKENRELAVARRDRLKPSEDDDGGTGGKLEADEIVFDDRAKNSSETEEVDVGSGESLSSKEVRELWLHRVKTSPADFLRVKFQYQLSREKREANDESQ